MTVKPFDESELDTLALSIFDAAGRFDDSQLQQVIRLALQVAYNLGQSSNERNKSEQEDTSHAD